MASVAQQLAEAQREMALRQRVYPTWIQDGRIKAQTALERPERQAAIVATLPRLSERERPTAGFGPHYFRKRRRCRASSAPISRWMFL